MFSSLTPAAASDFFAPAIRAWMMRSFQRAWTMAMRRSDPIQFGFLVNYGWF